MPANAVNINAGTAVVKLMADNKDLLNALKNGIDGLNGFASVAQEIGNKLRAAGTLMLVPFQEAAQVFADFDARMRMVGAVTGSSSEAMSKLTEKAKELGATTVFSASQVAEGMASLGRMGFNPTEIDNAIKSMMDLSLATGTDLAQASEIAANNMRVFGMNTSQMTDIADLLAFTANGSAQTLEDLGEVLKTAGPIAARAGVSLKDTAAQLGVLANMGIRGSMAGTAIAPSCNLAAWGFAAPWQCGNSPLLQPGSMGIRGAIAGTAIARSCNQAAWGFAAPWQCGNSPLLQPGSMGIRGAIAGTAIARSCKRLAFVRASCP